VELSTQLVTPESRLKELQEELKQAHLQVVAAEYHHNAMKANYAYIDNQINVLKYSMIRMNSNV
jgi:chromosome segregation ATPase